MVFFTGSVFLCVLLGGFLSTPARRSILDSQLICIAVHADNSVVKFAPIVRE